jgi:hypothetical protein
VEAEVKKEAGDKTLVKKVKRVNTTLGPKAEVKKEPLLEGKRVVNQKQLLEKNLGAEEPQKERSYRRVYGKI